MTCRRSSRPPRSGAGGSRRCSRSSRSTGWSTRRHGAGRSAASPRSTTPRGGSRIRGPARAEADLMRAYAGGPAASWGFCSARSTTPSPGPAAAAGCAPASCPRPGARPSAARVEAARVPSPAAPDVVIEPRKLWPAGCASQGPHRRRSEGRALTFADTRAGRRCGRARRRRPDGAARRRRSSTAWSPCSAAGGAVARATGGRGARCRRAAPAADPTRGPAHRGGRPAPARRRARLARAVARPTTPPRPRGWRRSSTAFALRPDVALPSRAAAARRRPLPQRLDGDRGGCAAARGRRRRAVLPLVVHQLP